MPEIRNIVILTGAGISAESGIDTFRDAGGLWEQHRVEQAGRIVTEKGRDLTQGARRCLISPT